MSQISLMQAYNRINRMKELGAVIPEDTIDAIFIIGDRQKLEQEIAKMERKLLLNYQKSIT